MWALAVTLNLNTANKSFCVILWPMMMQNHIIFGTKGSAVEETSRWTFIWILDLSCDLDLDHNIAIQSFHKTFQLMTMCHQIKSGCKRISSSEDVLESHTLIIRVTVSLTLKTANQSFWKTIWLMMMHHRTKFRSKRFSNSDQIIWTNTHQHFEIWFRRYNRNSHVNQLLMLHNHTKFGKVMICTSEDMIWTNIQYHCEPLLWLDLNTVIISPQDTLGYDAVVSIQVWLQTDQQFRRYTRNEWMKIYKWHLRITTQSNACSQRQVPPQTKNTLTLGPYNPQKLTPKAKKKEAKKK